MTVETSTDRAAMLSTDDWAESFVLPGGGTVSLIFDDDYAEELDVETSTPTAVGQTSDLTSVSHETQLVRSSDGTIYQVINIQPDGVGMTRLFLEEQ